MIILQGENIEVFLGPKKILREINLYVREEEIVAVLGANGAGKTTLLRVLTGIIKPTRGNVFLFGKPLSGTAFKQLAYLPQKSNYDTQFPLKVSDMVQLGWGSKWILGGNGKDELENVEWALKQVGLAGFEKRYFTELSGGQQQLVLLARTLYGKPKLIFLDEPTTGLDLSARQRFYDLLISLRDRLGLTILIVSHDLEAVSALSDRLIVLEEGRVVYDGEPMSINKILVNRTFR